MLAGVKPLAMFCEALSHSDYFPVEEFAPHVVAGRIVTREELYARGDSVIVTRCLFYALPGQEWRIEAAHRIQHAIHTGQRRGTEADDVELGRLLGYTDAEVAAFLAHVRRCLPRR